MWESARHVRGSTAHFDEFDDNFEVGLLMTCGRLLMTANVEALTEFDDVSNASKELKGLNMKFLIVIRLESLEI
jgi:hypothetical protein